MLSRPIVGRAAKIERGFDPTPPLQFLGKARRKPWPAGAAPV
jgi:hypothetical protein